MIKKDNLVSVIIPVYNVESYIKRCVESVIGQTYEHIEILLVDDGATDNSGAICDEYARKDDRIKVLHKENGGLSDARNYGLDRASGDYIIMVDGDDFIHKQMIEFMLNAAIENAVDIVACKYVRDGEDVFKRTQFEDDSACKKIKVLSNAKALSNPSIIEVNAWNKLYKRNLFETVRYPVGRLCEDEYVFHEIVYMTPQIVLLDIPLYFYTNREGSIMDGVNEKRIMDGMEALSDRVNFVYSRKWTETIPYVIMRYCEFCIHHYYDLQRRSGDYAKMRKLLHKQEKQMLDSHSDVEVSFRYKIFSMSPILYNAYVFVRGMKNNIVKHGVSK